MELDFKPRSQNDRDTAKPTFFLEPVYMSFRSEQEGRPIYEDREHVRIITPGMSKSIAVEEVNAEHKARWPNEYKIFKDGLEESPVGTPLEKWPPITPAMCLMLKAMHVRTVEELAELNDNIVQDIGLGGRQFRDKAREFVSRSAEEAPIAAANARADAAEASLARLQAQMDDILARMPPDPEKRGPGRPRTRPLEEE